MPPADYILDFVIPAGEKGERGVIGPTGPQGPQGNVGPTGPTMVRGIISINYENSENNNVILLNNASKLLYPANCVIYNNTDEEIIIQEDGFYMFSFFGLLKETITNEGAVLSLTIGDTEFVSVVLDAGVTEIDFSRIFFRKCKENEKIFLTLNKTTSSNALFENGYIIIQQIYLNS